MFGSSTSTGGLGTYGYGSTNSNSYAKFQEIEEKIRRLNTENQDLAATHGDSVEKITSRIRDLLSALMEAKQSQASSDHFVTNLSESTVELATVINKNAERSSFGVDLVVQRSRLDSLIKQVTKSKIVNSSLSTEHFNALLLKQYNEFSLALEEARREYAVLVKTQSKLNQHMSSSNNKSTTMGFSRNMQSFTKNSQVSSTIMLQSATECLFLILKDMSTITSSNHSVRVFWEVAESQIANLIKDHFSPGTPVYDQFLTSKGTLCNAATEYTPALRASFLNSANFKAFEMKLETELNNYMSLMRRPSAIPSSCTFLRTHSWPLFPIENIAPLKTGIYKQNNLLALINSTGGQFDRPNTSTLASTVTTGAGETVYSRKRTYSDSSCKTCNGGVVSNRFLGSGGDSIIEYAPDHASIELLGDGPRMKKEKKNRDPTRSNKASKQDAVKWTTTQLTARLSNLIKQYDAFKNEVDAYISAQGTIKNSISSMLFLVLVSASLEDALQSADIQLVFRQDDITKMHARFMGLKNISSMVVVGSVASIFIDILNEFSRKLTEEVTKKTKEISEKQGTTVDKSFFDPRISSRELSAVASSLDKMLNMYTSKSNMSSLNVAYINDWNLSGEPVFVPNNFCLELKFKDDTLKNKYTDFKSKYYGSALNFEQAQNLEKTQILNSLTVLDGKFRNNTASPLGQSFRTWLVQDLDTFEQRRKTWADMKLSECILTNSTLSTDQKSIQLNADAWKLMNQSYLGAILAAQAFSKYFVFSSPSNTSAPPLLKFPRDVAVLQQSNSIVIDFTFDMCSSIPHYVDDFMLSFALYSSMNMGKFPFLTVRFANHGSTADEIGASLSPGEFQHVSYRAATKKILTATDISSQSVPASTTVDGAFFINFLRNEFGPDNFNLGCNMLAIKHMLNLKSFLARNKQVLDTTNGLVDLEKVKKSLSINEPIATHVKATPESLFFTCSNKLPTEKDVNPVDFFSANLLDVSLGAPQSVLAATVSGPSGSGKSVLLFGKPGRKGFIDLVADKTADINFFDIQYPGCFSWNSSFEAAIANPTILKLKIEQSAVTGHTPVKLFDVKHEPKTLTMSEFVLAPETIKQNIESYRKATLHTVKATATNTDSSRSVLLTAVTKAGSGSKLFIDTPGFEALDNSASSSNSVEMRFNPPASVARLEMFVRNPFAAVFANVIVPAYNSIDVSTLAAFAKKMTENGYNWLLSYEDNVSWYIDQFSKPGWYIDKPSIAAMRDEYIALFGFLGKITEALQQLTPACRDGLNKLIEPNSAFMNMPVCAGQSVEKYFRVGLIKSIVQPPGSTKFADVVTSPLIGSFPVERPHFKNSDDLHGTMYEWAHQGVKTFTNTLLIPPTIVKGSSIASRICGGDSTVFLAPTKSMFFALLGCLHLMHEEPTFKEELVKVISAIANINDEEIYDALMSNMFNAINKIVLKTATKLTSSTPSASAVSSNPTSLGGILNEALRYSYEISSECKHREMPPFFFLKINGKHDTGAFATTMDKRSAKTMLPAVDPKVLFSEIQTSQTVNWVSNEKALVFSSAFEGQNKILPEKAMRVNFIVANSVKAYNEKPASDLYFSVFEVADQKADCSKGVFKN